jgi:hypothetical protein
MSIYLLVWLISQMLINLNLAMRVKKLERQVHDDRD